MQMEIISKEEAAVEVAECGCCGMREECTEGYIGWVKGRFCGVWVCGLCEEAVKDEQTRFGLSVEAALRVHASFRESVAADPTVRVVQSLLKLLRKVLVRR
ncbi:hypothetical protein QJS10_CPA06g02318 [Acorus calamus]|uniref:Uncharacterized protein n=1 Tax=Acorus calamus TaxID=4465 RepID=A0AAV9EHN9_ACOCL|nr:hypothetical protein QJS10_CPA06g02325 [Acorus calamus]KAK1314099.1 hypothetical protein QJS10_CPA06g02318 [Acorus calamus]